MYLLLTCFPGIFLQLFPAVPAHSLVIHIPGGNRTILWEYLYIYSHCFIFFLVDTIKYTMWGGGFCLYLNSFYSEVRSVDDLSLLPLERMEFQYDPFLRIQGTYPLTPPGIRYRNLPPHFPSYLIYRGPNPSLPQILDIQGVYPFTPPCTRYITGDSHSL